MVGKELIYYGFGHLAYAVALSDGKIQSDEKRKLHDLIINEVKLHGVSMNISEIIFNILESEHLDVDSAYKWAFKEFEKYKFYLSVELIETFKKILTEIAEVFNGIEANENAIIQRFEKEALALLN